MKQLLGCGDTHKAQARFNSSKLQASIATCVGCQSALCPSRTGLGHVRKMQPGCDRGALFWPRALLLVQICGRTHDCNATWRRRRRPAITRPTPLYRSLNKQAALLVMPVFVLPDRGNQLSRLNVKSLSPAGPPTERSRIAISDSSALH